MITKEDRENMISIAKPFMMDGCADPLEKDAHLLLMRKIQNEKSKVGEIILECMSLAYREGYSQRAKDMESGK